MSLGLSIDRTDDAVKEVEKVLLGMSPEIADVENISAVTGTGKGNKFASGPGAPHKGYLDVKFADFEHRKVSSWVSAQ